MTTATLPSQSTPDPSAGSQPQEPGATPTTRVVLDVVVPVYNEEAQLEATVRRLDEHLRRDFPYSYRITVADNASTDNTSVIARRMSRQLPNVRTVRLEQKGRGRALSTVWSESDADVLAYMDVDLSTDLNALLPLVAPLISGHSDLAIGSRLARGSHVVRGPKRELISRCYNLVLRGTLAARFSDAQCGFKAIRRDVAQRLLPMVQDTGWFFDTEMLVLAEKAGLRIHEVPVDWVDDPDSRVDIVATAVADLKGVIRVSRALATGKIPLRDITGPTSRQVVAETTPPGLVPQLMRFIGIGVVSTMAYLLLYVLLRQGMGAQGANFIALLVTAIGNTAANRRLTFGVSGSRGATKHQLQGLAVFGLGLLLTSGSLALLHAQATRPSRTLEAIVLVGANLAATVLRFVLLRAWVFRATHDAAPLTTAVLETSGSTR
jgi:putative flippase GtrA